MAPRVLVADDDRALQVLLNVILSRAGFEVDFASTGSDALRKATGDSYDAIMLDLLFPDLSGVEVLQQLKTTRPDSLKKVIVLTGAARGVVGQIDTSEIRGLLQKPFDIHDVIRLTAGHVRKT